jgi:hypothetical protein
MFNAVMLHVIILLCLAIRQKGYFSRFESGTADSSFHSARKGGAGGQSPTGLDPTGLFENNKGTTSLSSLFTCSD